MVLLLWQHLVLQQQAARVGVRSEGAVGRAVRSDDRGASRRQSVARVGVFETGTGVHQTRHGEI